MEVPLTLKSGVVGDGATVLFGSTLPVGMEVVVTRGGSYPRTLPPKDCPLLDCPVDLDVG